MELIIVLIIAIVICLILNISLNYIISGVLILIGILSAIFAVSFLCCVIILAFSKRKEAKFVRTDYAKNSKIQVAFYMLEGAEYPCMFPKEGILENKLYRTDRTYHVMWNRRLGKVFDRYAFTTCILGLIVSVLFSMGIFVFFFG